MKEPDDQGIQDVDLDAEDEVENADHPIGLDDPDEDSLDRRLSAERPEAHLHHARDERVAAGRLVDPDEGLGEDDENELVGDEAGDDDGRYSAEESAMRVERDM
ncbi:DUF5709 domain-containing protein [Herbidospora mongoliensis]|uniref:DUF5709 domain-containing protein n=1 Tax=Herbidospora mongoliensis TaxID=688067 RepID=UPI000830835A|nr:DUF5709 domain-containing protein [Herbidospora mongoliensis]